MVVKVVQRYPRLIVCTVLLLLIFSIYSSQYVVFEYSMENYFDKSNWIYRQYKQYTHDFKGSAESVFILIKGDDVTRDEVMDYISLLSKELKNIKYVGAVVIPRHAESPLIPKPTLAMIVVYITTSDPTKYKEIAQEIERVIEFTPKPPGITVEYTGHPVFSYQIMKSVRKSLGITTTVSIILMILILVLIFSGVVRRKILAFLPLLISVITVIFVYSLTPVLGIPITEVTNSFIPILIGLAIEYAAQLQSRFEEERREGRDTDSAVNVAIITTGKAIALAMLTTVIGFLSMLLSGVPALGWFGILSALGLVIAFVLTLTFLASILKLTDVEVEVKRVEKVSLLEKSLGTISKVTVKYPAIILIITAIVLVFGAYSSMNIKLETNPRNYAPQDLPAIVLFKELERTIGGQYYYTIVLKVNELNADIIKKIDELGKYIVERENYVDSYDTISTLIKRYYGKLPDNDVELEMILARIPTDRYISGHWIAIHLATHASDFEKQKLLYESIKRDVQFFGWDDDYYVTGPTVIRMEIGNLMLHGQTKMTIGAYILVIILMLIVYRSILKALVPLLSITTVIAILNAIMFTFGIKHTIITTTMNSIIIGLGIDFSIHVLERYLEERRKFDPTVSVIRSIERTGKAITTSALTMAGGFGALLFSPFPLMQTFGLLSLVAIIFSLLASFTAVPAFLITVEKFRK